MTLDVAVSTRVLAALAIGAAVAVAPAAAAPQRDALIRPGVGIGKVRLGMTVTQVKRLLGRHDLGTARARGFGNRYLELTWWSGLADHFTVRLYGRKGGERVVLISTDKRSERTPAGIRPGVPMTRVKRAFPAIRCQTWVPPGGVFVKTEYVLRHRSGVETVFVDGGWRWNGSTSNPKDGRYSADNLAVVIVRAQSERQRDAKPCG